MFSVEITESSGMIVRSDGQPIEFGRTGVFYYFEEARPGGYGPLITGYRIANDQVTDVWGGGSAGSEMLINTLKALPLVTFDVASEIESTIAALKQQAQRDGGFYSPPSVRDGNKYRITYNFNGVEIIYEAWNPGPLIDDLAKHSTNIANFKELIDLFAEDYGRNKFGL